MCSKDFKSYFYPFLINKFESKFLEDEETLIVPDTNYLLAILSLPDEYGSQYLKALKDINIYVPYIVALEFNFNKYRIKFDKIKK
ncbi:hypothetical protein FFRU_040200 [Fructobacillus fructosus]|uniref:hypothetical protein n=1 Tax=Fructobacillus fructosus TaxID=1631 RepID=UPI000497D351|nr:hypothetical protein [Fructobacillus fructosus]GAP01086.1 hypothetical protein FFRU_040200 [Fructobacillus fructosus]